MFKLFILHIYQTWLIAQNMELVTSFSFKNVYKTPTAGSRDHLTHTSARVLTQFPPTTHTHFLHFRYPLSFLPRFLFSKIFPMILSTHPKQTKAYTARVTELCNDQWSQWCVPWDRTDWLQIRQGAGGGVIGGSTTVNTVLVQRPVPSFSPRY